MTTEHVDCVTITVAKPGCEAQLLDALQDLVLKVRQQRGFIRYDLHRDLEELRRFFAVENWATREDFDAHCNAPEVVAYRDHAASWIEFGVSQLDIVFVHDLTPGNSELGDWQEHFEIARTGAFQVLSQMRDEGIIKGWGLGVNNPEPILAALEVSEPDIMLAATQYSLLEHEKAMTGIMPALEAAGASVMVGAPQNAGFLAGRNRLNYGGRAIPQAMLDKRSRLLSIAQAHEVDLRVASLQFANAHPVVSCIIPGASSAEQAIQNVEAMSVSIPADFWAELRDEGLLHAESPVPA